MFVARNGIGNTFAPLGTASDTFMIYPYLMTIFSELFFNEPNKVFGDIVVCFFFTLMGIGEEDGLGSYLAS